MESSYYTILEWRAFKLLALIDPVRCSHLSTRYLLIIYFWILTRSTQTLGPEREVFKLILKQWTGGDIWSRHKLREGFLLHNQHIRDIVPTDNLLEFRAEDGWAPLCKFLGKEIPDEPYPKINEGANAAKIHVYLFWRQLFRLFGRIVRWPLAIGGLAWGLRWMQGRGGLNIFRERLRA